MKSKAEILQKLAQTESDRVLIAQALDKLEICENRQYLTNTRFLDLRERSLVAQAIRLAQSTTQHVMLGGYEDAERACAVFYPDYMTAEDVILPENRPITVVRALRHPSDTLTHRDYLGALMGLQIKRDCIGDILVHEEGADIIVLSDIVEFLLLNFDRAGRKRLRLKEIDIAEIQAGQNETIEKEGSVASMRLDSVTALLFGISRADAQAQILHGQVFLNFLACEKPEKEVAQGDRITLRGKGRGKVTALCGHSRKGRQFLRYVHSA